MTLAPGTKLGPYEILEPIGAGGMGEVWKARDTRLGRVVAIKKVKEQHSERFKQEARSIAALNHQNICQLFDIGPDYLVLEYVEGKPLSSPLPEKEAVRLAIQITTALEEAHQHGIIHRDLKPSNIMVTDKGSVKLLDFGLAKLYEQSAGESTAEFPPTQTGAVLGTVAYMSPEQAQGRPADARSDIFSFGLVLYEMLSGRRAFGGDSTPAIMAALLRDDPPPLQASPALEKIVRRCLAKQPSGRYQAASEIKSVLEQISIEKPAAAAAEPQPSIAVLPFVNMSGDKEQEYFSDGLAEEIINALAQIPGLKVIARTSAFSFRGRDQDIRRIAEALSVTSVLEGSVRRSGNRIRVTAQLINAADGSHLWSQRYDSQMTDVFAIQDEISLAIADKLRIKLAGAGPQGKRHTEDVEAYNLYLKGRYPFTKQLPDSVAKSRDYYEQAIAADPGYALPWFGLALFHWWMGYTGIIPPAPANTKCGQALLKALAMDETLPEGHSLMGVVKAEQFDWAGAESEFRRALELGPKVWDVWFHYSEHYLLPLGRPEEAVTVMRSALELDPLSPILRVVVGLVCIQAEHVDQAIEQYKTAIELDPHFSLAHLYFGEALLLTGKFDEGVRASETCVQIMGRSPLFLVSLGYAYAIAGRGTEAREILAELQDLAKKEYVSPYGFAQIRLGLGEIEECLNWLDKAVEEHSSLIYLLGVNPVFAPLRSHPRYRALLRKMNLEESPA